MENVSNLKFKIYLGLDSLSGVAAILRYPLPDIDDIVEDDYED